MMIRGYVGLSEGNAQKTNQQKHENNTPHGMSPFQQLSEESTD